MLKKQSIAVVSTSLTDQSRSRIAAQYFVKQLKKLGAKVEWIDLQQTPLKSYPQSENDKNLASITRRVHNAHALVLAFPIYNWGESGQTRDFLAYVLDKKKMKNRVCFFIAGCSTQASFFVPMDLSKTLQAEIGAVVLGGGIMACGDDVNRETGEIKSELKERLEKGAQLVYRFSKA